MSVCVWRTGVKQAAAGQMAPLEVLADAPVRGTQRVSNKR